MSTLSSPLKRVAITKLPTGPLCSFRELCKRSEDCDHNKNIPHGNQERRFRYHKGKRSHGIKPGKNGEKIYDAYIFKCNRFATK